MVRRSLRVAGTLWLLMPLACDGGAAQEPDSPGVDGGSSDGQSDAGAEPDEPVADGGAGDAAAPEPGQLPSPWSSQCVATFTSDFIISDDPFAESGFMVKKGEQYLLKRYRSAFNEFSVFVLDEAGASTIGMQLDGQPFPFTSNCAVDLGDSEVGVFVDAVLYEDEALTTEACRLEQGTIFGFGSWELEWLWTDDANVATYRLTVDTLATRCQGNTVVYFKTPSGLLPVDTVLTP